MKLFSIALASVSLAAIATPASAQSYYARQPVAPKQAVVVTPTPTPTPEPTPAPTWVVGEWSSYNSTCSTAATRTRSVVCTSHEGAPMGDSFCAEVKPASTDSTQILSGCTYTATAYGAWSSCSNGKRSAQPTACRRSDLTMVSNSFCEAKIEDCSPRSCSENFIQYRRTMQTSDWTLSAYRSIVILPNDTDWKAKAAAACSNHNVSIIGCFVNHLPDGRVNVIQHKETPTTIATSTAETHWVSTCTAN